MHANSGYEREALPLIARTARLICDGGCDAVVAPSESCVAMIRHHYLRLVGELDRLPAARGAVACPSDDRSQCWPTAMGTG
ncbi:MAG: hypothetical protein ACRDNJ_17890 [Solirubrobacteraceae bacterium]